MTDEEILRSLFKVLQEAAHREIPLKTIVEHVKTKQRSWDVWQKNKVHLVTFFTMEWKRAREQDRKVA